MDKAIPELKLRIKKRPLDGSVSPKMLSSGGLLHTIQRPKNGVKSYIEFGWREYTSFC